ncbi:unnamed protein product [Effrenium voratum]|uniref:Fcf2 pre-rRNA processing C-terminal domain-containing protein n=1 Tax=Effrenium voratum TaxID=2562239 RepID=A0AA36I9N2_9DINO|nr:unnamed protein product [Effrenium voratum]CAJ1383287.1 unnamed protein product [Effrenium voratum]CAJ1448169.1 unnamed protein product [Effrenium voratum]
MAKHGGREAQEAPEGQMEPKVKEEASADDDEEGEEEEAEEEEDPEVDMEAIAQRAVDHALKLAARKSEAIKLDTGLREEELYLPAPEAFNTASLPGRFQHSTADLCRQSAVQAPNISPRAEREQRGAPVRPVDDAKERRAELRRQKEEKLDKWFGLPKHKMTPELEKELKALRLRANFDPKRFYKANDRQELPKYFTIATEVGGGMAPVGLNTKTQEVSAHSGRSFLDTLIRDEKVQEWTQKKLAERRDKDIAAVHSGHGKRGRDANSTRRGGAWKKRRKG